MKAKEGHSSLLDWLPLIGYLTIILGPTLLSMMPSAWLQDWVSFLTTHKKAFAVAGLLLWGAHAFWHSFNVCDKISEVPDILGTWERIMPDPKFNIRVTESNGEIRVDSEPGDISHVVRGHFSPAERRFIFTTTRTNKTTKEVLEFTEIWVAIDAETILFITRGKEGKIESVLPHCGIHKRVSAAI